MNNLSNPRRNPQSRRLTTTQQLLLSLGLVVAVLMLTAQSCEVNDPSAGPIPQPPGNPTPCTIACPPPVGPALKMTPVTKARYEFYYDPQIWQEDSTNSNANTETLYRNTPYGQVSAQFFTQSVASGTMANQLLATWTQQHVDPNKFTAFQDAGPIDGAEIGFNAGAGEAYEAIADLPNAPNTPLFIELMSSIKGTTGIIFAVVSPLDPSNPDPSSPLQVRSGSYDRLVNTLIWL